MSIQSCAPHGFRFIELVKIGQWRTKLCGIAWPGELSQAELIAAAKKNARAQLVKEKGDRKGAWKAAASHRTTAPTRREPNQALQPAADRLQNLYMTAPTLKFGTQLACVSGGRALSR
jgi:hypothetical protein